MVWVERIELPTSCSQSRRTTWLCYTQKTGAGERNRTLDLLITSELLCQLSYSGKIWWRWKDSSLRSFPYEGTALDHYATSPLVRILFLIHLLMAPQDGIEPPTNWLTANCTTSVLLRNGCFFSAVVSIVCMVFASHQRIHYIQTFHPLHDQKRFSHCQRRFGLTGTTHE
jgi:hypothetical protein